VEEASNRRILRQLVGIRPTESVARRLHRGHQRQLSYGSRATGHSLSLPRSASSAAVAMRRG